MANGSVELEFGPDHTPIAQAVVKRAAVDPMFCRRLGLQAPEKPVASGGAGWWRFDTVRVDPTAARYIYSFCHTQSGQSWDWTVTPWAAGGSPDLEIVNDATVELLMLKARSVWKEMASEFMDALRAGTTTARGRVGSPYGPVHSIPSDAWIHLEVSDWAKGLASEDADDEPSLYNLHTVERADIPDLERREPKRRGRNDDLFREVLAILSELYPAGPPRTRSIKQLQRDVAQEMTKRNPQAEQPSWATVRRVRKALEASLGQ